MGLGRVELPTNGLGIRQFLFKLFVVSAAQTALFVLFRASSVEELATQLATNMKGRAREVWNRGSYDLRLLVGAPGHPRNWFAKVYKGLQESGAKSVERLLAGCFPGPQKFLHEKANDRRHA